MSEAAVFLSIAQAASESGVSTMTIRRRISDGTLTAYRVGPKMIRIKRDELTSLFREIPTARRAVV